MHRLRVKFNFEVIMPIVVKKINDKGPILVNMGNKQYYATENKKGPIFFYLGRSPQHPANIQRLKISHESNSYLIFASTDDMPSIRLQ